MSLSSSGADLEPHPLAHSPILEYAGHPENPRYEVELAVYDDHLVFLLGFTQIALVDRIIAWNWKDGTKAVKHAEHETLDGFLFLRKGTILVPSRDTGSIVIYNYELGSESGEFRAILCLTLPGLKSGLEYGYIKARTQTSGFGSSGATPSLHEDISGPSPSTDTQRRTDADDDLLVSNPTAHSVPFSPFVEDSIIAISVHITYSEEDSDDEERAYNVPDANGTLIVKKKTLFRWIHMCEEESRRMTYGKAPRFSQNIPGQRDVKEATSRGSSDLPSEQVHSSTESNRAQQQSLTPVGFVVPWSRWMQETRWLRDQVAPHWIRDVYGMRVAIRVENPETASATSDRYLPTDDTPNYASHPSIAVHYPVFSQLGTSRVVVYPRWGSEDEDPIEIMNRPQDPEPEPEEEVHEPVPPPQYSTRICDFNYGPYLRPSKVVPYPDHFGMDISIDYSQILEGAKSVESSSKPPTEAQAYARRNNRFVKEKKQKAGGRTTFDRGWSSIGRESGLEWTRRPVYEPTYIPANSTFAEPILTRLPYLEITSRFFNECTSLMMDGERVITMKTDDSNKLAKLEVLVI
ncbi:hypothetical protein M408DRAFT_122280 [Serendipita vermifera MAFF 305830]|uniref:Uncharacterized protein n=1 Tax=Serendipita vermifera MAFF 305830 TaxID=933852 RepID=A0A0C2WT46_SERVB|nr:hypothetical protein M408DRAFT_122280 [Serendipita vermifera MAFF 305830]